MNLFFYNIVDNMYKFKITHALLVGNRISIYRFFYACFLLSNSLKMRI